MPHARARGREAGQLDVEQSARRSLLGGRDAARPSLFDSGAVRGQWASVDFGSDRGRQLRTRELCGRHRSDLATALVALRGLEYGGASAGGSNGRRRATGLAELLVREVARNPRKNAGERRRVSNDGARPVQAWETAADFLRPDDARSRAEFSRRGDCAGDADPDME